MPSTGNKATTPFKSMDIKSALISAGSRKRKAPSPQVCKSDAKNVKLSLDSECEKDVEILDEVFGITVTLDQSALQTSPGDCKENKDINSANTTLETPLSPELKENKDLIAGKDELSTSIIKTSPTAKLACPSSPKSTQNNIDMELDQSLSEKSKFSDNSSCDELDTSVMNSSINVSLNTSGHSISGDDCDEKDDKTNSKKSDEGNKKAGENIENDQVKEKSKKRKMTPIEAKQKAEEREQKQKERLLKKQELDNRKKEKLIEKERRMLERQMREDERKEKERIKQEKKEQEEKERLLKQKEKEEKLQQKLEEKKRKEEVKQKREEEQRKAEEEKLRLKLEKEQKEREKKERAKAAFVKFFVRGDTTSNPPEKVAEKEGAFLPFQVSDDMILAPVVPPAAQERFDRKQLDQCLEHQDGKELYLQILKTRSYKDVRLRKKNRKLAASEADVIIIDKNAQAELGLSAKLLQFSENVRPPYWGTWRKKSKNISPRNPFGEDVIFDYSVDSDDEWDEGGPGESLSGTEPEDESDDEYEVDNEFFVPHGYLSDEEEKKEDDDEEVNDPEKQKALLKIKLQEFELERKKKTTELKPIILGCYFVNVALFQDAGLQKFLQTFSAEVLSESPIPTYLSVKKDQSASGLGTAESPKSSNTGAKKKKNHVPEEALPQLIRLVHGNTRNRNIMAEEFQKFWLEQYGDSSEVKQDVVDQTTKMEIEPSRDVVSESTGDSGQISLRQLRITIKSIATYGKPPEPTINKCCWWVHDDVREKYGLMDAPFPNQWNYCSLKVEEKHPVKGPSIKGLLSQN